MLIGLTGVMGSGKDTAGQFIIDYIHSLRMRARRDAFADRLKVSAAKAIGFELADDAECISLMNEIKVNGEITVRIPRDEQYTAPYEHTISGRSFLQYYGTEAHRDVFGYDFWVDAVLSGYDIREVLVVTDVRFDNEAQAVRDKGGVIWEVKRPGIRTAHAHPSEQGVDPDLVDLTIVNDGTLDDLKSNVLTLVEQKLTGYVRA